MLYLLYLRSGFIKKFPLDRKVVVIGRSSAADLMLNEPFVSQRHAKIDVFADHIVVKDLGSTNGIFFETTRIKEAKIGIDQCFRIGYINIFLKEGSAQDFVLSKKVEPVLSKISDMFAVKGDQTQEAINLLYSEPMIEMLQIGFKLEEFIDIFRFAEDVFAKALQEGSLVLLTTENDNTVIESKWNYKEKYYPYILEILQLKDISKKVHIDEQTSGSFRFCSFPFVLSARHMLMIYLVETGKPIPKGRIQFLKDLSIELSIIDSLIEQNKVISRKEERDVPEIITKSQAMLNLLFKCKKIAASDLFVIIEGETGTGKELLARLIHAKSKRNSGDFVALNCAAVPETLMESELFGHEKGAFTDAKERRIGKLELSSGGTLVLDEIGDMPLSLQKKLLRAIQEGQFYRVGGNQPIKVDLRIICLTHTDILELLRRREFREDLYYRLSHVILKIDPLRERREDIIPLINHFVNIFCAEQRIAVRGFSQEAIKALETYHWPGNVRELKNEIKKVISLADDDDIIDLSMLKEAIAAFYGGKKPQPVKQDEDEKERIVELLEKHKWNKTLVSKEMGISRTTLYEKLQKYKIE